MESTASGVDSTASGIDVLGGARPYVQLVTVILASVTAAVHALTGVARIVALSWFDHGDWPPGVSHPLSAAHDYWRAAGLTSVNLAVDLVCVWAIITVFRNGRLGRVPIPWLCLAVAAALATLTFVPSPLPGIVL